MVQPTPKKMTREQKEQKVEELRENIEDYPVVGILDMHNLPSRQLQQLKKEMKDFASIRMSRKTLMNLSIDEAEEENIEILKENEAIQPAFIFSEKDPFQLYSLIQENKTSAAAQGGEIAPSDIVVSEGDTGIGPGPLLKKLGNRGVPTDVGDEGTIEVQEDAVMIEKGEEISNEDADILNQLGIEPLEIGLDLTVAYSDGELFQAEELDIDPEEYMSDLESAAAAGFNLAVNSGVVTDRTAPSIIREAVSNARSVSISEGIPTGETIEDILARASGNAESLDSAVDTEDVETGDEEENEEDGDSGEETEEEEE